MSINIKNDQFLIMMCKACNVSLRQVEGFLLLQNQMKEYALNIDVIKKCEKLESLFSEQGLKLNESLLFKEVDYVNKDKMLQKENDYRIWVTDRWQYSEYIVKNDFIPCKFKENCARLDCKYLHYKNEYICTHELDNHGRCLDPKCSKIVLKLCLGGEKCKGELCTFRHINK